MIIIKEMNWGNWFSYGDMNHIELDDAKVTQITGINGSGKSSIPVIIGEILYGKNALGKTKAKLSNRYVEKCLTWGVIEFEKDNDKYRVEYDRKSTLKLQLIKNEIDISSHTTSDTYKTLTSVLGYDFKTFWGLIYQSSKEGLEFLTATDTNRKKFLIKLFNLDVYLHIHELFKSISTQKNTEIQVIKGKLSTIESWIKKNEKEDLTIKALDTVPTVSTEQIDEIADLKVKLGNLREDNQKINNNNLYKQLLSELDTSILSENFEVTGDLDSIVTRSNELQSNISTANSHIKVHETQLKKISELKSKCFTCEQDIPTDFKQKLIVQNQDMITFYEDRIETANKELVKLQQKRKEIANAMTKRAEQSRVRKELSDLLKQVDDDLPDEVQKESDIQDKINELSDNINKIQGEISRITSLNLTKEAHNSKVKVIKEQLQDYRTQLSDLIKENEDLENTSTKLNIIKKAFSTNGLLSYKLEHLSKDLENQINIYLAELSKGRFQLSFTIVGEKLNVEIIDDGASIGIEELSAGELARVNTSTLLAIRKLMAAISSTKINILFLDEITGVLDDEGKEVLIDILSNETELNTFLVSHEFTHPLIPQINIVKENKISRIED